MLTDMMEGLLKLAPDAGGEATASSPIDYGTTAENSAPDLGNAGEQAVQDSAVGGAEADATKTDASVETSTVQTPAWMAQLPKELRNDSELAKHRTIGDAIKYLKAEAEKGTDAQTTSAKDNADETTQASEQASPVKYDNFAKHLSDSNDPFGNITDALVETLQTLNVPQNQAEAILEALDASQQKGIEEMVKQGSKHTEAVLRKRWGREYDSNRRAMAKGYQALGDKDGSLQKMLDQEGASLSPAVWEVLVRVGRMTAEDSAVKSIEGQTSPYNPGIPVTYKY